MKILKGFDIAKSIKQIKPQKIAVAFIGSDFDSYLDDSCLKNLESIVLSPTEGSNPKAISKLVKKIGWDKINFLSRLHAKIYIGRDETIVGSSNLSRNGLIGDVSGLYEICVKIDSNDKFNEIFNEILNEAREEFPNEQSKLNALNNLWRIYNKRKSATLEHGSDETTDFEDYDWGKDEHFYMAWYNEPSARDYTDETKDFCNKTKDLIENDMAFAENDKIDENEWVLCWRCQKNYDKIHRRAKPCWLYIDKVISKGWDDGANRYTKLAVQLKSYSSDRPKPPFEITEEFIESFRNVVDCEEYKILFNDNPYIASSEKVLGIMPKFLADIKRDMMKKEKY